MPRWEFPEGTRLVSKAIYERLMEEQGEAYSAALDRITARLQQEYEREFGEAYRAAHPFKPNNVAIHRQACKELGMQT